MLSIYNASAGSGKTFALTREYLRMLLRDTQGVDDKRLPHSRILAVTFTKKSTAEMKERILRELYTLSTAPNQSDYIKDFCQDATLNLTHEQIQQRAQHLLVGILQDYTRFSVSTIDGFFQQVIRTFARELGLSATYDLSLDGDEMIQQAVDDIFKRIRQEHSDDKELIEWMMDFIQKNIDDDHQWNPNSAIKSFAKQLLREQVILRMPELQQVFSDKSFMRQYRSNLLQICQDKEQAVAQLLTQANAIFSTQQGWQTNILKAFQKSPEEWLMGNMGKTFFNILDNPASIFVKGKTTKEEQQILLAIYEQQLAPIFLSLNELCTGTSAQDYATAKAILPHLYTLGILQDVAKQIEDTNRTLGRLPISETNQLVHQIIDGQDTPFIYERFGQYFRHYMIDEFQDTSALQWENFLPLIQESDGYQADNLIVGDVKQSIYRFRNSDWSLLKHLHEQFPNHKAYNMPQNWRTAPVIVEENEKFIQRFSKHVAEDIEELKKLED